MIFEPFLNSFKCKKDLSQFLDTHGVTERKIEPFDVFKLF